jgi:hypothetical protein
MPGDVVRLEIWREPELSFEQTVPTDGTVIFHKLGRTMSVAWMRKDLLRDAGSRVQPVPGGCGAADPARGAAEGADLGAVRNPSIYTLHPTMSLSDALAMAGGPLAGGAGRPHGAAPGRRARPAAAVERPGAAGRRADPLGRSAARAAAVGRVAQLGVIASVLTSIFVVTISVLAR